MPAPPETGPDACSSSSHPRLHSCSSTKPGRSSACRCCASSSSLPSPSRTREPWVMFNSPARGPQPSRATAGSQALTSKDWGASAFAWLAMPMGQAESSSRTGQTLLIYQGRLQLQLEHTVDGYRHCGRHGGLRGGDGEREGLCCSAPTMRPELSAPHGVSGVWGSHREPSH